MTANQAAKFEIPGTGGMETALTEFLPAMRLLLSGPDAYGYLLVDPEGAQATVTALTQRLGMRKHAILLRHALHG